MPALSLPNTLSFYQREEATSGRVADALNPWCCRLTRAEARFQQQHLAAVPAASLHIRAALLLRLNDRIEVRHNTNAKIVGVKSKQFVGQDHSFRCARY